MERVSALVAALWLLGAEAELTLPPSAFIVHSASWGFTEGEVPPEEVLQQTSDTECHCHISCLTQNDCLSWLYDPDGQSCTQLNVRGNRNSQRPAALAVWYREALAYLGDWCANDRECSFLTSGVATCQSNTCSCPEGLAPTSKSECGTNSSTTETATSTTKSESSSQQTSATTAERSSATSERSTTTPSAKSSQTAAETSSSVSSSTTTERQLISTTRQTSSTQQSTTSSTSTATKSPSTTSSTIRTPSTTTSTATKSATSTTTSPAARVPASTTTTTATKMTSSTTTSSTTKTTSKTTSAAAKAPTTTTTKPSKTVVCSEGVQYMIDETDCTKFYQCSNGEPVSKSCSETLVWNEKINNCDRIENVPRCS